jgi:hypothetical protein
LTAAVRVMGQALTGSSDRQRLAQRLERQFLVQPVTRRRAKRSRTTARYSQPSPVHTYEISAFHFCSGVWLRSPARAGWARSESRDGCRWCA